nr:atrial natriuretic peptide receptor 1-like isoform X1 [Dermatophagoides farinae]
MVDKSRTNRFDLVHIGPAIDIAMKKCQSKYKIYLNLTKEIYPNQCNETAALGKAYDVISNNKIIALIGPACSDDVQVVGRLAAHLGIPILTGLGDVINDDRSAYSTLIRTSYDLRDKARAILAFMAHHNWYHFGLIYRYQDIYYSTLAEELFSLLQRNRSEYKNFVCTCKESYNRDHNKTIITNLRLVMERMRSCARIIVIIGGEKEVRNMMLIAYSMNMTNGDYAFIYTELIEKEAIGNTSWAGGNESKEIKEKLKFAYQSLLILSLNQPPGEHYKSFSDQVKYLALKEYNFEYNEQMVNYFTASFHDSVILLCKSLRENQPYSINQKSSTIVDLRKKILKSMKNVTFSGISGNVTIDLEGDRIADYALLDQTDPETGLFEVALRYYGATQTYESIKKIHWPNGKVPKDFPKCGFDGAICKRITFLGITIVTIVTVLFILILLVVFILRKIKYKFALANMSWKIRWDEIEQINLERSNYDFDHEDIESDSIKTAMDSVVTGIYKGNQVVIKKLRTTKFDLSKEILIEVKIMREISHDNLTRFFGICTENCLAIVTEYCSKGSLRGLLANSSLNLDWIFRCSIINDIISGMTHLHNSEHIYHGRLHSNNCLIDSRFCVKISDFGLRKLKNDSGLIYSCQSVDNLTESMPNIHLKLSRKCQLNCLKEERNENLLYYAPEFFIPCKCKKNHFDAYCLQTNSGSQKGDLYSFGIILQEIILRQEPFYPHHKRMHLSEIIKRSKFENLRPIVPVDACVPELYSLMVNCWSTNPDDRPDFHMIKSEMKNLMKTLSINNNVSINSTLTENLLIRMEQYATDLEMIVRQRTNQLAEEKKKTEELLYQILPKPVADQLKRGKMFEPNFFDSVTLFFSDIVGFTHLSSNSTPMQVVDFLNDLYTFFDSIISDYDVYKVETIGDSYMVVSGLPEKNGIEHARQICRMALKILEMMPSFVIKHRPEEKLKLRIGINTGPCCAGCVGNIRPRFCLFGDAVNTASRMESNGEPLKIHVSSSTKSVLELFGTFILEPRGEIFIKGKGKMLTYWLLGEK